MNYIVFDMEWNQPFFAEKLVTKPVLLHGEIIQIGAVKLDEAYQVVDTFNVIVAPKYYRKMHKRIAKLTGIQTEDLQHGLPFATAFSQFEAWCGKECVFLTWGPDDIEILRTNLLLHQLDPSILPESFNLQVIFDHQISKTNQQLSLEKAMVCVGEEALESHDALNDAKNTAKLCLHLDMKQGFSEYYALEKGFTKKEIPLDSYHSDDTFAEKETAFQDAFERAFFCPTCGKKVAFSGIVPQNNGLYLCLGDCEGGERYFVRIRARKRADDVYVNSRDIYPLTEENEASYQKKKEKFFKYLKKRAEKNTASDAQ